MNNAEIARVFSRLASLSQIKGESTFIVRAYRRVAYTIERLPVELEVYVRQGRDLKEIGGIGDAIAKKIKDLLDTGRLELYEKLQAGFPPGLLRIMDIPGVGPKTALRIYWELGVTNEGELERAIGDGRVEGLPGLGKTAAENILRNLRTLRAEDHEMPINQGLFPRSVDELRGGH